MTDEKTPQPTSDNQNPDQTPEQKAAPQQIQDVSLAILNQYVRDLSFENPNAPGIFASRGQPEFSVSINMGTRQLQDRVFELIMKISAQNRVQEQSGFMIEIEYAGVFSVGQKVPDAEMEALLYIEGGKFLFPFARHIMAEVSRMGGFPPVLLQMIDFNNLYHNTFKKKPEDAQLQQNPTGS